MAVTLSTINNLINDKRRDTGSGSIDMTAEGFRAINSTLNIWQQMHDWEFTLETSNFNYNEGITYYSVPTDFKSVYDLRFYKGPKITEFDLVASGDFDKDTLKTNRMAIQTLAQTQLLRVKTTGLKSTINSATAYNNPGTWAGASGIGTVATDSYEYFELGSSVSFAMTSVSAGTLTNSTFTAVDLSRFVNRSNVYFNVYLGSVSNFTSITLKWGTDASNYYTYTSTTDYLGSSFAANTWTKVKSPWSSATTVGTPTNTSIAYLQVTFNYSVAVTASSNRIENFFVSENTPISLEYYSTNMVINAAGTTKSPIFQSSGATTDKPLWTGSWDYVSEAFAQSVMEIIFWITGEYTDEKLAIEKIAPIVDNLKRRLPTRKRNPEMSFTFE